MILNELRCGDVLTGYDGKYITIGSISAHSIHCNMGTRYTYSELVDKWTVARRYMFREWMVGSNRYLQFRTAIIEMMHNQDTLYVRDAGEDESYLFAPPFRVPNRTTYLATVALVASAALGFSRIAIDKPPAGTSQYRDYLYRENGGTFTYRGDRYTGIANEHDEVLERLKGNVVVTAEPL